ncbi:MAG: hypothetical protein KDA41_04785, partial [Planctomycetales bacterium]|nr:hypothetical protein [Planctomycetales bacterium]
MMRAWSAIPDWAFRAVGCVFFFGFLCLRLPDYFRDFWSLGPYFVFDSGYRLSFPWTRVLVDLTCLQIALSYLLRVPAASRAQRGADVFIAMLGGLWPIVPFLALAVMWVIDPGMSQQFTVYLWRSSPTLAGLLAGTGLILLGNAIDVWGYSVLFRSFSIV